MRVVGCPGRYRGHRSNAVSVLFTILADRGHRHPAIIVSQSGPTCWVDALPDRVAADSTVKGLASLSRIINLGAVDTCRLRNQDATATSDLWE